MDPISIAATSAGLAVTCIKITGLLYTWIDETRNVDATLTGFCEEILALSRILDAISAAWKQNPSIAAAQAAEDGHLWRSVKMTLDDCKGTLEKLDKKLAEVRGSNSIGTRIFGRANRQIRLSLRAADIAVYRQRVQYHNGAVQLALQMINICMQLQSSVNQEAMASELVGLRTQIGRIEAALESREALQTSPGDIQEENGRIIRNLQQYVRAAESFHSNASNIVESVNGGSVMGDPLTRDRWSSIERWIPPPQIPEEPVEEGTALHTPSPSPSTNSSTQRRSATTDHRIASTSPTSIITAPQLHESDSESDLERETTRKFHEMALRTFEQKDYGRAETFLRKIIDRTRLYRKEPSSRNELLRTEINLAIACSFQEKWKEVESIALPLARMKNQTDIEVFHIVHALAVANKDQGDMTMAVKYTKQALNGKRKLLGKTHESFFESMILLAQIYDKTEDSTEAEVYRSLLPAEFQYDSVRVRALTALQYLQKSLPGKGLEERKPRQTAEKGRLIIGIDFGGSFSGAAFLKAPTQANGDISKEITLLSQWAGSQTSQTKIPSILYYDQNQKVLGWGCDIKDASSTPLTGSPKPDVTKNEWFRLQLAQTFTPGFQHVNLPPLPGSKSEVDLVGDYLDKFRTSMTEQLRTVHGLDIPPVSEDIDYYFAVSPFWNDSAKKATMEAAVRAGIFYSMSDYRLHLISEAEAAAVYCFRTNLIRLDEGGVVLIIDCGGCTTQLIALQLEDAQSMRFSEFTAPSGDICGSQALNRSFSAILRTRIKKTNLLNDGKLAGKIYWKTLIEFENRIKRAFKNAGQEWRVHIGSEPDLPGAGFVDGHMTITDDEISQCFDPAVKRIHELMDDQITAIKAQNQSLEHIILVGGFSASDYLYERIRVHAWQNYFKSVIRPSDPMLAVLKGAVMMGVEACSESRSRPARRHYLIGIPQFFNDGEDLEEYRIKSLDGYDRCMFTYKMVIRKGQRLQNGEVIDIPVTQVVTPCASLVFESILYTCHEDNCPRYVSDSPIHEFLTFHIDLSKKGPNELDIVESGDGAFRLVRYHISLVLNELELTAEVYHKDERFGEVRVPGRSL